MRSFVLPIAIIMLVHLFLVYAAIAVKPNVF